jgi:hypothetical protein
MLVTVARYLDTRLATCAACGHRRALDADEGTSQP